MKLKIIIGVVISAVFVYLSFRKVELAEMWQVLKSANYLWLIPALVAMLLSHWIRAWRWQLVLEPIRKIKVQPLFSAVMIGYAANNIFPLRLGEFLRAHALGRSQRLSKSTSFATIVVERILLDLSVLLLILASTMLLFTGNLPDDFRKGGYLVLALVVSFVIFVILLIRTTGAVLRVLESILPEKIYSVVRDGIPAFIQGCTIIKESKHFLGIVISSLLIWLLYALTVYLSFFAFEFHSQLNFFSSFVLLATVAIGMMFPSSPGYVGTYHWATIVGLSIFGVSRAEASGYAVVSHALNVIPITIIGLGYFWRENLHFSDAVAEKEEVQHELGEHEIVGQEPSA